MAKIKIRSYAIIYVRPVRRAGAGGGGLFSWLLGTSSMIGMVAGDGSDADGDVKYIPTGPYEEVGGSAPLNFFGNFYWF